MITVTVKYSVHQISQIVNMLSDWEVRRAFRRAVRMSECQMHVQTFQNFSTAFCCFETPIYYNLNSIKWDYTHVLIAFAEYREFY